MSYLLEILGRGLLVDMMSAFRDALLDEDPRSTPELERAVLDNPEDVGTLQRCGIRLLTDKQPLRAQSVFRQAVRMDPYDVVSNIGLACALDESGSTQEAFAHLAVCREQAPDEPRVLFALGLCAERLGRYQEAAQTYAESLDVCPDLRNAHERLAAIALKQGDVSDAISHYEYLNWCDPGDVASALSLANLYVRARRFKDAARKFEFVVSLEPDHWEVYDDLAATYQQSGDFARAIDVLAELSQEQPDKADYHVRLGDLYGQTHEHERSMSAYLAAWELNPDHLEATVKIGTCHLRKGEFVEAAKWFGRAVELNDQTVNAYIGLGVAQQAMGELNGAETSFQSAAAAEPNSGVLFSEVARLQLKASAAQYREEALLDLGASPSPQAGGGVTSTGLKNVETIILAQIEHLRRTLIEHADHADLHYKLGILLRHTGDIEGAASAFREALSINPRYLKAINKLGLALRELGEDDEAADLFRRGLDLDPHEAELHYQLGLLFADRENFASAVESFQHACEVCPDEVEFHAHLALALQNMGLLDRAAAAWETLLAVAPQTPRGRGLLDDLSEPG